VSMQNSDRVETTRSRASHRRTCLSLYPQQ